MMKRATLLLSFLAALLLFTACGEKEGDTLTIKSSLRGQALEEITLTCKEDKNCPWVKAFASVDLDPVPEGAMCTRIYGGPEEIELVGQVDGREIKARFNRSGGCEITRYESLAALLAAAGISKEELFPNPIL